MRRWARLTLAVTLAVTGCTSQVEGVAVTGSREVGAAYYFAGDAPTYGLTVSRDDITLLTYFRAVRRIDPCGLLTRDALAKVGDIGSVGTLFAFDECDVDLKVPGEAARHFVSVEVVLTAADDRPALTVENVPVYESYAGSCEYLIPLGLSRLPGARPLETAAQPYVQIGLIAESACPLAQRLVQALAPRVGALRLQPRDAVGVYPIPLAERDPCELLSVFADRVSEWRVRDGWPYACSFMLQSNGSQSWSAVEVAFAPQEYDVTTDTRTRVERDGVEVFVDETDCSALTFVAPPMQRKLLDGDYVSPGDIVIRPAVVVQGGGTDCETITDMATAAAKLYS